MPATVTIAAGQTTSAAFTITGVDDAIADGTQTVTVTGAAAAHADGTDTVDVTDDEAATLTVTIDRESFSENGGTATGTVTRNTGTSGALLVNLSSNDTSEATVPVSVTIPDGSDSVTFPITGIDDLVADGLQTVTITATAASGYSLVQTTNLDALGLFAIGGLTYDDTDDRLWVSDAALNTVFEVDPFAGTLFSSFDVSVAISGLTGGPDGVAVHPGTGELYFFEGFGSQLAGVTTQAGAFVRNLTSFDRANGAAFNDAEKLFVFNVNEVTYKEVNTNTGAILSSQRIVGVNPSISAIDFDPVSGNLFAYNPTPMELLEIEVSTGNVLSTTDLSAFFGLGNARGMAFNTTGDRLFISNDDDQIVVLGTNASIFIPGTDTVVVTDDEAAGLTVTITAAAISENGGTTAATVSRNTDTTNPLTVTLVSNDTGEATVPANGHDCCR